MGAMGTAAATATNDGGNGAGLGGGGFTDLASLQRPLGASTASQRPHERPALRALEAQALQQAHLFAGLDRPAAAAAATTLALVPPQLNSQRLSQRSLLSRTGGGGRRGGRGGGGSTNRSYSSFSVVPQRAELPLGSLLASMRERSGRTPFRNDTFRPAMSRVAWPEQAKRRARHEHFDAERELDIIRQQQNFNVQVDLVLPLRARQVGAAAEGGIGVGGIGVGGIGIGGGGGGGGPSGERIAAFESMTSVDSSEGAATVAAFESMSSEGGLDPDALVLEVAGVGLLAFAAQADIELSFGKGEVLLVMDVPAPDGWLMARNYKGEQGLVPEAYLRKAPRGQRVTAAPPPAAPAPAPAPAPAAAATTPIGPGGKSTKAERQAERMRRKLAAQGVVNV